MSKNDSQIRDRLSEILKNIVVPYDKRKDYCEYKGKDKERYCKITTHKTCKGCHFFSPTMHQRLRVVVDGYDELEKVASIANDRITNLENQMESLKKINAALQYKVARLTEERCPDRQRCTPYFDRGDCIDTVKQVKSDKKSKTKIIYK